VHSVGPTFGPWLNSIGRGGLLTRWPKARQRPIDAAHGHTMVAQLAHASRCDRRVHGMVTVAGVGAVVPASRARWWLSCSAVDGVSMRTVRGGRRARRMAVRLTKGSSVNEGANGVARWCFFEAEGLTGVRVGESSLASTWRSGRRRAPTRCSSK
jgi:hypothetical protein